MKSSRHLPDAGAPADQLPEVCVEAGAEGRGWIVRCATCEVVGAFATSRSEATRRAAGHLLAHAAGAPRARRTRSQ